MRYSNGRLRDGYTKGKLFIGVFGLYDSSSASGRNIQANHAEIGSIKFVSEDEILTKILPDNVRLRPKTAQKSQFVAHILDQIA
jgi:NADH pyrophosphatase NudC (nudix superfamily)